MEKESGGSLLEKEKELIDFFCIFSEFLRQKGNIKLKKKSFVQGS